MLLYTRVAPPKVPKRRSRAGCSKCKDKKKKCDEERPQCSRCKEHGFECVYEPIRPRQRRKRDSISKLSLNIDTNIPRSTDHYAPAAVATPLTAATTSTAEAWDSVSPKGWLNDETRDGRETGEEQLPNDINSLFSAGAEPADFNFPDPRPPEPFDDVDEVIDATENALVYNPRLEFCPSPAFGEFTTQPNRRALVDHFCSVLSHLIVFREDDGNPFQQLVLPLSQSSPAVMDAIYALASAHLEFRGVRNQEKSVVFHSNAIQGLARLIEQGVGVNRNELLAAIMLLVYYEVLVQRGRSNIVDDHLKGAMTIITNSESSTDPTGQFLERAFRFYDVIAALSLGTAPLASAPGRGCLAPFPPLDSRFAALSPLGNVDALLGMSTTLWPIIHRLSSLPELRDALDTAVARGEGSKVAVLRSEFEITACAVELALDKWEPALSFPESDPVAQARFQSILNNALAYRHSALVYLYRTIHGHPRRHALVQRHAHASLTHCLGTVSNEGPMGALLWPLFVAACEAVTEEDRMLAREAFAGIDRRQGMMNIERAFDILQEVWRRADVEEMAKRPRMPRVRGDLWRRVSEEMGVSIVFG